MMTTIRTIMMMNMIMMMVVVVMIVVFVGGEGVTFSRPLVRSTIAHTARAAKALCNPNRSVRVKCLTIGADLPPPLTNNSFRLCPRYCPLSAAIVCVKPIHPSPSMA